MKQPYALGVALGTMMVADAALAVADTTLLVSADTDLVPALVAVRRVKPSQRIYLAMPPGSGGASRHQASVGGLGAFSINETALRNSQLPAIVAEPRTGAGYRRPTKWA